MHGRPPAQRHSRLSAREVLQSLPTVAPSRSPSFHAASAAARVGAIDRPENWIVAVLITDVSVRRVTWDRQERLVLSRGAGGLAAEDEERLRITLISLSYIKCEHNVPT